jgi:hypothetical protein
MMRRERAWDPIVAVDTPELFREYLQSECSDEELVQWVMRKQQRSNFALTESATAIISEALGYLTRAELIELVALNEDDRCACPAYRRWCISAMEAREERRVREGVGY